MRENFLDLDAWEIIKLIKKKQSPLPLIVKQFDNAQFQAQSEKLTKKIIKKIKLDKKNEYIIQNNFESKILQYHHFDTKAHRTLSYCW